MSWARFSFRILTINYYVTFLLYNYSFWQWGTSNETIYKFFLSRVEMKRKHKDVSASKKEVKPSKKICQKGPGASTRFNPFLLSYLSKISHQGVGWRRRGGSRGDDRFHWVVEEWKFWSPTPHIWRYTILLTTPEFLLEEGYLLIRRFLDVDKVERARQTVLELCREEGFLEEGSNVVPQTRLVLTCYRRWTVFAKTSTCLRACCQGQSWHTQKNCWRCWKLLSCFIFLISFWAESLSQQITSGWEL